MNVYNRLVHNTAKYAARSTTEAAGGNRTERVMESSVVIQELGRSEAATTANGKDQLMWCVPAGKPSERQPPLAKQ